MVLKLRHSFKRTKLWVKVSIKTCDVGVESDSSVDNYLENMKTNHLHCMTVFQTEFEKSRLCYCLVDNLNYNTKMFKISHSKV